MRLVFNCTAIAIVGKRFAELELKLILIQVIEDIVLFI